MDVAAARRARQKTIKANLSEAYTDEEACPPEWLDLLSSVRAQAAAVQADISGETRRFIEEPDIRTALVRRERVSVQLRDRIAAINQKIRRLNLIAPHARFTRAALDVEEVLRPLYRSRRNVDA
jgi:hypothetical protein